MGSRITTDWITNQEFIQKKESSEILYIPTQKGRLRGFSLTSFYKCV